MDIVSTDLEKKNRTGNQLMTGRQLYELAKKGTAYYRKALALVSKKFDLETMECKESGQSVDDVVNYILLEMYKLTLNNKSNDDDEANLPDKELEEEIIINNINQSQVSSTTNVNSDIPSTSISTTNSTNNTTSNKQNRIN